MPILSNKRPLKVFKKKRPDDGLFQAETNRLKIFTVKLCMTVY
jgi:hypothetical protein